MMFDRLKRFGIDGFILAMAAVILLAYAWPAGGLARPGVSLPAIGTHGVTLIFFFYGLKLSPEKFAASLHNIRLHLMVQGATFVLFPLILYGAYFLAGGNGPSPLWIGVLYVAALPSTVSSSVVMVNIARGNVPAAIFNASISGLIGIAATPLLMNPVLSAAVGDFKPGHVIGKLVLQVLLPVALGMLLHRTPLGRWMDVYGKQLRYIDQAVILLIVYTAFCDSFANGLFGSISLASLMLLVAGMAALFAGVFNIVRMVSAALGFTREDRITAMFCGTKKSLVHATAMSKILFAGIASAGIVLLPIMLYHALQLVFTSMIAQRVAGTAVEHRPDAK